MGAALHIGGGVTGLGLRRSTRMAMRIKLCSQILPYFFRVTVISIIFSGLPSLEERNIS
jgi:hypothetical protein